MELQEKENENEERDLEKVLGRRPKTKGVY